VVIEVKGRKLDGWVVDEGDMRFASAVRKKSGRKKAIVGERLIARPVGFGATPILLCRLLQLLELPVASWFLAA